MDSYCCPLCGSATVLFHRDKRRPYFVCRRCCAVHVPEPYHLSEGAEKAEYDKHQNHFDDEGYRTFLARMAQPIGEMVKAGSKGLEFGCGPGPVLAQMLTQAGYEMTVYDKFYADNRDALEQVYDFVTTTEVIEHLRNPQEVLARLWMLLKPGGTLGVMTKRVTTAEAFSRWHYKNDQTHIIFFHSKTFEWLGKQWGASLSYHGNDVVLLKKPL